MDIKSLVTHIKVLGEYVDSTGKLPGVNDDQVKANLLNIKNAASKTLASVERKQQLFSELQDKKALKEAARLQDLLMQAQDVVETELSYLIVGTLIENKQGKYWLPIGDQKPIPIPEYLYAALFKFAMEEDSEDE